MQKKCYLFTLLFNLIYLWIYLFTYGRYHHWYQYDGMQVLYICYTYVFLPFYISCTKVYFICVPQVLESPINGLAWQFLYNWIHMTTFSQRSIIVYLSRPHNIFTDKFLSDWTQFLTNYSFVASIIPQLVTLLTLPEGNRRTDSKGHSLQKLFKII